ncbi:micronuclear linker histone polyprotein-like isoform X2 [Clytia hemisphaerica]|uniref:Uncharacterized protein n=1 Tax=Clytia hemisphaerica TaxID=252671 RepID=A0A7M5U1U5_9CNID
MPERKKGRTEETHLVLSNMIRKASHDLDVLMGILIEDGRKVSTASHQEDGSARQRKHGKTLRHPLDMVNFNKQNQEGGEPSRRSSSTMERYRLQENMKDHKRSGSSLSLLPLKRTGSVTSSIVSRKSSAKSVGSNRSKGTSRSFTTTRSYTTNRSNGTVTSQSSYIKKNSGNFDGSNDRSRRKSSLQRKSSASSRREQLIADFYRDLEELDEERSCSDSSDDENDSRGNGSRNRNKKKLKKGRIEVEEVKSHQRVQEYLMKLEHTEPPEIFEEDEGIRSDMSDGRLGSSYNSNYSNDIPMETNKNDNNNGGRKSEPRYIKRPNPPDNMIADLEDSPRTHRLKVRDEYRKSRNDKQDSNKYDVNKNNVGKKTRSANYTPRVLPQHPKEIELIDKNLRESFNNKRKPSNNDYKRVSVHEDLYMNDSGSESSCSTDSAHGSTHSISTVSSISVAQKHQNKQIHQLSFKTTVPKNFIPGQQQKHILDSQRKKTNRKPKKVSFCFRGIPFRVYNNTPRTHRALAHAGCIALIIPAPGNHKCRH